MISLRGLSTAPGEARLLAESSGGRAENVLTCTPPRRLASDEIYGPFHLDALGVSFYELHHFGCLFEHVHPYCIK